MIIMLSIQIESLHRKKGLSQAELAQRLHISPSAIGMYEQGRREPSIDILVTLSEELDVSIDYLITGQLYTTDLQISVQTENILEKLTTLSHLSREDLLILLISKMIKEEV